MIAANYTLELYCDCDECTERGVSTIFPDEGFAEYTGNSWAETARMARKDGWRISKCKRYCYAPGHKIKRNKKN